MADSTSDTRDDVMQAISLHDLFCERTATDFRPRIQADASGLGLAVFLTLAALFYLVGHPALAKGCLAMFVLQVLVFVWTLVIRSPTKAAQLQEDARRGVFPAQAAPIVLARLRWWNHLVTPRRWARQSRVLDRRHKLELRIAEIREHLARLPAPTSSAAPRPATSAGTALAAKIRTFTDREEFLRRVAQTEEEASRLTLEAALYEALMARTNEVITRIERLEQLSATIYDAGSDLSRTVVEALNILEERRTVVRELDAIDPEEFLRLITF